MLASPFIHPKARVEWAPVARDQTTGHYWFLRQNTVRPLWNLVQCGCCGLYMTSHSLASRCQGFTPDNSYLFTDVEYQDEDLDFVSD